MANEPNSRHESSTEAASEQVLLNSYRFTRKEVRCTPTYHTRRLRNKKAILVLISNYLVISFYYYIYLTRIHPAKTQKLYYIIWGLTLPFVGWLADVCLGRHRMIRWSIWIMWLAFILMTLNSLAAQLADGYDKVSKSFTLTLLIVASVGFGGYQANVIQFGLDQLHDASTDEITSFISWYVWTFISGGITVAYANLCTQKEYSILTKLLVSICLSIALILSLLSDKTLIKEPVAQNPFKLVYQVIKYTIKNKHPRCRSAFTYCEEEHPSRIDFGKNKYGGPFTTEQVEDVKTFFRLLSVIIVGCMLPGVVVVVNELSHQFTHLIHHQKHDTTIAACTMNKLYAPIASSTAAVLIPLYEFVFYPVLRKYFHWVQSHLKFLLGVSLQMARVITLMTFVLTARYNYLEYGGHNNTIHCIFHEKRVLSFNSKWLALPNILNSLSIVTLAIGSAEFVCAQTPYYMRGLMFGAMYGTVAVFALTGYGISKLFTSDSMIWSTGTVSCEFWYLLLNIILLGITGAMMSVLGRWYKKRKREDVLPNEQIFAERYYTKYQIQDST